MKMNVESFNLDHRKVKAPYVRVADRKKGEHGDLIIIEIEESDLYLIVISRKRQKNMPNLCLLRLVLVSYEKDNLA